MKTILYNAWKQIEKVYLRGEICSERHLQSLLFHILNSTDDFNKKYQIRVEPKIKIIENGDLVNQLNGIIPDLLIINGNEIKACIELKYVPYGYVSFKKDIINLSNFFKLKGQSNVSICLSTNPLNGEWDYKNIFTISSELLLVYSLIANKEAYAITDSKKIWSKEFTNLEKAPEYLQFIEAIDGSKNPMFYLESNTAKTV